MTFTVSVILKEYYPFLEKQVKLMYLLNSCTASTGRTKRPRWLGYVLLSLCCSRCSFGDASERAAFITY